MSFKQGFFYNFVQGHLNAILTTRFIENNVLMFYSFKHEQLNCLKRQNLILYVKQTLFTSSKPSILH